MLSNFFKTQQTHAQCSSAVESGNRSNNRSTLKETIRTGKVFVMLLLLIGSVFVGCKKDNSGTSSGKNVYVAGFKDRGGWAIAELWINGEDQKLSEVKDGEAKSVFVSGKDVYVAGDEGENEVIAKLWKNGVAQNLANTSSRANSIYVSDNDVYVAGYMEVNGKDVATLWKNGEAQDLGGGRAYSVFVSDGDVYVIKQDKTYQLWKNGVQIDNYEKAGVKSIFVSNNDVYIAGWRNVGTGNNTTAVATLWKNGEAQGLTDGTCRGYAYSVFVSDGDVYVAGYKENQNTQTGGYGNEIATLWKNGEAQELTDGTCKAGALSVFVSDGDVYVSGYVKDGKQVAKLWINGVDQNITSNMEKAHSIFVK